MFKNQYDSDITTWSPNGRLFQVEYAMESVKQGSATVGVKSKTHVVLVALKRSPKEELASYQEKIFLVDDHCGMSATGLISDGRVLARMMRSQCMEHQYLYGTPQPIHRLVSDVADKYQMGTLIAGRRPYGVGLLIAGQDSTGPQLMQTVPSGDFYSFKATAMGSRSQSARTYLEKHFNKFEGCSLDDLVTHALKALANCTGEDVKLNIQNTTIAVVGKDTPFTMYTEESARQYLDNLVLSAEDRVADNDDVEEEDEDAAAAAP